ncbi:SDR family NAD(P)-dependent oxidoreductase [Arthrobacter sp. Br18]|uniref:SDR family NAD(P)-dependent oxidoreductase n=1 Tax=Arthrobacter sp. Br18 TaxID=1312954 RepID=UPI0004789E2C|nr:SDR family NAD(P)-dependent oxidoreductase [Arthrobacter sp. Br18]
MGALGNLINSAGTNIRTAALDVTEAEWDTIMDVNLKGAFFTAQTFARTSPEDGQGKIINISSQYGYAALRV